MVLFLAGINAHSSPRRETFVDWRDRLFLTKALTVPLCPSLPSLHPFLALCCLVPFTLLHQRKPRASHLIGTRACLQHVRRDVRVGGHARLSRGPERFLRRSAVKALQCTKGEILVQQPERRDTGRSARRTQRWELSDSAYAVLRQWSHAAKRSALMRTDLMRCNSEALAAGANRAGGPSHLPSELHTRYLRLTNEERGNMRLDTPQGQPLRTDRGSSAFLRRITSAANRC